jgi:5-formyltetrahydrofolate cyclo-ligase
MMPNSKEIKTVPGGSEPVHNAKVLLRKEMIARRKNIPPAERARADEAICRHLLTCLEEYPLLPLVGYITDGTEPDLRRVLEFQLARGGSLFVPRFLSSSEYDIVKVNTLEFPASKWGIPEPGPDAVKALPEDLRSAIWLIPGVSFDADKMRLGRGKGVYDRLLADGFHSTIGVFYECQKCQKIPSESHDCSLDRIVTEQGIC